jgi:hypothetical protein
MSLKVFSASEHEMVIDAERRYGDYFLHACNTTILLSNIMMWPIIDCDLFIRFLSQMKKYHTLSVLATVRLHRIQAKMDLRYFLESSVHAGYSLVHTDTTIYFDYAAMSQLDAKKASLKAYRWIEAAFPDHSKTIRDIKAQINEQMAHANVINSQHNFRYVPGQTAEIHTSFFDFEDDKWTKVDLWQCAQSGLIAIDLLLAIQKQYGGFLPSNHCDSLPELIEENESLLKRLST